MKKLKTVYSIFLLFFVAALFLNNSSNPPNGRTGAPGESTCSSCHNQNGNFDGILNISGLPSNIQPNTTYPISVTVNVTSGAPVRAGFQLVALDGNDNTIGTLTPSGSNTTTQSSGGRTYVEHNPAKNFNGGMVTYTFDWDAPASAAGNSVTFYSAALMGNGSGTNGDKTLLNSVSGTLASAPNPPAIMVDSQTDVNCFGGNDGAATVSASGGTPPYNFTWTGGLNGPMQSGLTAGTYGVTVIDNAQESASTTITISEPSGISLILLSQTNVNCFMNTGMAEVEAMGGNPPYNYSWSNGETGPIASNLPTGTSTVVVMDQNQCSKSIDVVIASDLTDPIVDAGPDMSLDCNSTTVVLDGSGSSSGGSFTYLWTTTNGNIISGATTLTPTVNQLGNYILQVTDGTNGCQGTDEVVVTDNSVSLTAVIASPDLINCTNSTVTLDATGSSMGPNITYQWTTNNGNIISGASTLMPTVDQIGNYVFTVTDVNTGCTALTNIIVTESFTNIMVDAGPDKVLNCNSTTVDLDGTNSTDGNTIVYEWTTPNGNIITNPNTGVITVDAAGMYVLKVTDSSNTCTARDTAIVTSDTNLPTATIAPPAELNCNTASTVLDATGSTTGNNIIYQWNTSNGNIVSGGNTLIATIDQPGVYTLSVTNSTSNCSATSSVTVSQDNVPPTVDVNVNGSELTCDVSTIFIDAFASGQGPFSYSWNTGETTSSIQVTLPATYILVVTDNANGCTSQSIPVNVGQNITRPTANITASANELSCTTTSITLDASSSSGQGALTYLWNDPSASTTPMISVETAGNYRVSVTDSNNGCVDTASITITQDAQVPVVQIAPFGELNCTNTTLTLDASGSSAGNGFMFSWSTPDGNIVSGATTLTPVIDAPGSYTLQVNNTNSGCVASSTVTVVENRVDPIVVIARPANLNCINATVQIDGSQSTQGNMSYQWTTTNGNIVAGANSPVATVDAGGSYSLQITNLDNGCGASDLVSVNATDPVTAIVTADNILCFGDETGAAEATPSGGTGPYSFQWSTGGIQPSILDVAAGIYMVTITDSDSCQVIETVEITQPDALNLNINVTDVSCHGGNDGSLVNTATGGVGGYNFVWTFPDPTQLTAGDYGVSVVDANMCLTGTNFTVSEPPPLSVSFTVIDESANMANDGSVQVDNITGGTPPYRYLWSNGDTTDVINSLPPGIYTLEITDGNDCTYSESVTVAEFGCAGFAINLQTPFNIDCGGFVSAAFTIDNGTPPYQFNWSNGQTDSIGIVTDTFSVTVTDANGCVATEGFHLNLPPILNMMVGSIQNATGTDANGSASVNATGGDAPYQYSWQDSSGSVISNTAEINAVPAGTYIATVLDANGCAITLAVVVGSDPSTSVDDPAFAKLVHIYPNPSDGRFQIDFDFSLSGNEYKIDLYSFAGRLIEHRVHDTRISTKVVFNKTALPSGVYLLKIRSEEGVLVKRLLIE